VWGGDLNGIEGDTERERQFGNEEGVQDKEKTGHKGTDTPRRKLKDGTVGEKKDGGGGKEGKKKRHCLKKRSSYGKTEDDQGKGKVGGSGVSNMGIMGGGKMEREGPSGANSRVTLREGMWEKIGGMPLGGLITTARLWGVRRDRGGGGRNYETGCADARAGKIISSWKMKEGKDPRGGANAH